MEFFNEKLDIFRQNKVVNWHEHVWTDSKGELDEKLCDLLVESAYETYIRISLKACAL